jgi:hypothetical protein
MNTIGTSPDTAAATAGAPLLYGTCTISIAVFDANTSAAKWITLPVPAEP